MSQSDVLKQLHDTGHSFVVSSGRRNASGQKEWTNTRFDDLDKAEAWLRRRASNQHNVYVKFCVFDDAKHPDGRPDCTLPHVLGSRSFFIDLDYGPDKPFADLTEARSAYEAAMTKLDALSIPRPNILQETGHGLQAVWSTDRVFSLPEWEVINGTLYGLLREHGLQLDPAAKATERGVRMCGEAYQNFKGEPAPTRVLLALPRIPAALFQRAFTPHKLRVVPASGDVQREYGVPGGAGYEFHVADVVAHCEVLKDADAGQGRDHGFAVWTDLMALCARDAVEADGDAWAHYFSGGHPDYDPDQVDRKLRSYRASSSQAYVTCRQFGETFPEACQRCRFRGRVNSCAGIPKVLREEVLNPTALPDRYFNKPAGLAVRDGDEDVLVWPGVHVDEVKLSRDDQAQWWLSFDIKPGGAGTIRFSAATARFATPTAVQAILAKAGAPVIDTTAKRMHRAMVAWVTQLQQQPVHRMRSSLGWAGDGFALGDRNHTPAGVEPFDCQDPVMLDFMPVGSRQEYSRIASTMFAGETRPEAHALLATCFAGPLIELAGGDGMTLNFSSELSGYGKSSLARLAAAAVGKPGASMLGGKDTENAVCRKMATMRSLTVYYDDPQVRDPVKQYRELLFMISRGAEKQRLNAEARMQEHGYWKTLLVFLTNRQFSGSVDGDPTAGDATAARFMDFVLDPLPDGAREHAAGFIQLSARLDQHYGHIGPDYIAWVVRNQNATRDLLERYTHRFMAVAATGPADTSSRFQALAGACLVVAASYARTLVPVDPRLVCEAVLRSLRMTKLARRHGQTRLDPVHIVREFCHETMPNRVVTKTDVQGRTHLSHNHPPIRTPLAWEYDVSAGLIWLDAGEFRKWMTGRQLSVQAVMTQLDAYRAADRALAEGLTEQAGVRRQVLRLPVADPSWANLV